MLNNIKIVLVETQHPGNIGAVARAMKNMCLSQLVLVSPQEFPSPEADSRASGADDILASARVCGSLDEALQDCAFVIGASARIRTLRWPQVVPKDCAIKVLENAAQAQVAVIFGRERNGLTNAELERCHYLVHIPGNTDYNSLNIAAAVQVIVYEIYQASLQQQRDQYPEAQPGPVLAEEMKLYYEHLERVLVKIDFLDPAQPKHLMRRLKRLYNRAQPNQNEINILRGILTQVEKSLPPGNQT